MTKSLTVVSALVVVTACQSPVKRFPSSESYDVGWEELKDLHLKKAELESLIVSSKGKEKKVEQYEAQKSAVEESIRSVEKKLGTINEQGLVFAHKKENWRIEKEALELDDLSLYASPNKIAYSLSTYGAKYTEVTLSHKFLDKYAGAGGYTGGSHQTAPSKPQMLFRIACDGVVKFSHLFGKKEIHPGESYNFYLGKQEKVTFALDSSFNSCDLTFVSPFDKKSSKKFYALKLVNESRKLGFMDHLLSTTEVCSFKKGSDKFFETTAFSNMTCPASYDSIEILPEPEDSLRVRVQTLLGQALPKNFVKNGNPYAQLDFSKAPKFDAILLSYLVFRADFYGTLLARLLAYHADKGTFVRIITTKFISLDKDKALFEKTMAKHPNIKFVLYQFDDAQEGGNKIDQLHRTNHAKMFIAYSKENRNDSIVILGGKNVHDGFVFKTPANVGAYPEIVNYAGGDESWAYWRDFEMVVRGEDYVESMVRHYMSFYHINKENLVMQRPSVAFAKADAEVPPEKTMRHYFSIPFKDETNLNAFYAKMIDSSKKKVLISSPYFRPVKEISEALKRAIKRGVDISIITRLDLTGDTADFIIGDVNKDGVNQYYKDIKVYEYVEPNVILHSKLIMIDDEVTFISSVNLNKRSFYHDLENGALVNDPEFTVKMGELYKEYLKLCEKVSQEKKIIFWKKWIINTFDKFM